MEKDGQHWGVNVPIRETASLGHRRGNPKDLAGSFQQYVLVRMLQPMKAPNSMISPEPSCFQFYILIDT